VRAGSSCAGQAANRSGVEATRHEQTQYTSWYGNLITDKADGSGLQYMRNRYYDPLTGRFTQADPIGLAGGLNLYGFAGGDPVTYTDPFGLCPIPVTDCPGFMNLVVKAATSEWGQAFGMLGDWASGSGPASRSFGQGTPQVEALRGAPGTDAAREAFYAKNSENISGGKPLIPLTNFSAGFGVAGLAAAGTNGTRQFVGAYRVDVTPNANGTIHFNVSNTTSMTSASYHLLPSWERSSFGPGGNMREHYSWDEPVSRPQQ
jgi:RHS repeat-associated protein